MLFAALLRIATPWTRDYGRRVGRRAPMGPRIKVADAAGREVARTSARRTLAPGELAEVPAALEVANPHRWNGVADPYLHTLRFELRTASGELLDSVDQTFGIRTMAKAEYSMT